MKFLYTDPAIALFDVDRSLVAPCNCSTGDSGSDRRAEDRSDAIIDGEHRSNRDGRKGLTLERASPSFWRVPVASGTGEWHAWRASGIDASDAAVIMGEDAHKSTEQLMTEKLGRVMPEYDHFEVQLVALEPEARLQFCRLFGRQLAPAYVQSRHVSWLRASVHGLAPDDSSIAEFTCGGAAYQHAVKTGQPLPYYRPQLQHLLAITELEFADYVAYIPEATPICLRIERDDGYIAHMLCKENAFWERLLDAQKS
jgi:putative phage-type endonuclease